LLYCAHFKQHSVLS
jgi:sodium bicarbonate cotransporter 7